VDELVTALEGGARALGGVVRAEAESAKASEENTSARSIFGVRAPSPGAADGGRPIAAEA